MPNKVAPAKLRESPSTRSADEIGASSLSDANADPLAHAKMLRQRFKHERTGVNPLAAVMPGVAPHSVRSSGRLSDFREITDFVRTQRTRVLQKMAKDRNSFAKRRVGGLELLFFKSGKVFVDTGLTQGKLGKGMMKVVTKALDFDTGEAVASLHPLNAKADLADLENEANILSEFQDSSFVASAKEVGERDVRGRFSIGDRVRNAVKRALEDYVDNEPEDVHDVAVIQDLYKGDLRDHAKAIRRDGGQLQYAIDVLEGLSEVHAKGYSHRDIKPENLMVTKDHRGRIGDLGIASNAPTHIGGTPIFIHPDLYLEKNETGVNPSVESSQRADVYALGLSLTEVFGSATGLNKTFNENATNMFDASMQPAKVVQKVQRQIDRWNKDFESLPKKDSLDRVLLEMRSPNLADIRPASDYLAVLKAIQKHR